MSTLTLTAYGLTVTLSRFSSGNFPRESIETPDISRTAFGAINRRGTSYEPPHIWQVSAIVAQAAMENLDDMHRANYQAPSAVTVDDLVRLYSEASPRTRSTATGAAAPVTVGSRVRYHARFNAEFQGALTVEELGKGWHKVGFQMIETTKVAA